MLLGVSMAKKHLRLYCWLGLCAATVLLVLALGPARVKEVIQGGWSDWVSAARLGSSSPSAGGDISSKSSRVAFAPFGVAVGSEVPDFVLKDLDGVELWLGEFVGKQPVVLE